VAEDASAPQEHDGSGGKQGAELSCIAASSAISEKPCRFELRKTDCHKLQLLLVHLCFASTKNEVTATAALGLLCSRAQPLFLENVARFVSSAFLGIVPLPLRRAEAVICRKTAEDNRSARFGSSVLHCNGLSQPCVAHRWQRARPPPSLAWPPILSPSSSSPVCPLSHFTQPFTRRLPLKHGQLSGLLETQELSGCPLMC
jgi:hypothetical protein